MTSSANPVASAILAVYNGESTILPCLESLLTQSDPIEIIVIDDGSTDRTRDIVSSLIPNSKNIILLKQNHAGPALARNLGAKHAKSKILLFVDADMKFDKDYVKELIAPIQYGEMIGSYTVEERVSNWGNVWARCWNFQEGWEDKKRFKKNPPKYGTDYRAILKDEFDKIGGFDNIGYTDTWSLFDKLKQRPLSTHAICYHKNPDSLSIVYKQAKWAAKRPYKFGVFGSLYALVRTSLPVSIMVGSFKSLIHLSPAFLVFKIVYDFGRFAGILEMFFSGKLSK